MRKFRFPLEKVLTVRELRKLIAEEKLAAFLGEMYRIQKDLDDAMETAAGNREYLRRHLSGHLDLTKVQDALVFRAAIDRDITQVQDALARKTAEVRQAQQEVVARNQEMKALQRLKEKQLAGYRAMYWWEHSKQMDELGTMRFIRDEIRR
ncbi:MAG: flagellar export protein FliJ [Firmicutes bacterium]|nr:flagellar export protein FliJ [Candidatus Fermentithermobacillaceae bacterium]